MEEMLMIRPDFLAIMSGRNRCVVITTPFRFTSIMVCQSWSLMSRKSRTVEIPALFTKMSTDPMPRSITSAASLMESREVTSSATPVARKPSSRNCPARRCAAAPSRSPITTWAPSRAKTWATPAPIPDAPPVMSATLPTSCPLLICLLDSLGAASFRSTRRDRGQYLSGDELERLGADVNGHSRWTSPEDQFLEPELMLRGEDRLDDVVRGAHEVVRL